MQQMDIVFATVPMMGHLVPLLPFAEELMRRGHRVAIVHPSDPKYRTKLEQCGLASCTSLTYESKSDEKRRKRSSPSSGEVACMTEGETVPKTNIYDCIMAYYKGESSDSGSSRLQTKPPDVVVYDFFAVDAADAADSLGVPAICVFPNLAVTINPWVPSSQTSLLWGLWCKCAIPALEGIVARVLWIQRSVVRCRRGLWPLSEQDLYPTRYQQRRTIGCTSSSLEYNSVCSLGEDSFAMVGPTLPSLVDPLDANLDSWLAAQQLSGRKLVYVAFGSMHRHTTQSAEHLLQQMLDCSQTNHLAFLWSITFQEDENSLLLRRTLPPYIRLQSHVPQVALMQTGKVYAFITHCGSNSVYEALLSQVPMVCCPGFADQPGNALRLVRVGAGVMATKKSKGRWDVVRALKSLQENYDTMQQSLHEIAEAIQRDGGSRRAASIIENVAKGTSKPEQRERRWCCGVLGPMLALVAAMSLILL